VKLKSGSGEKKKESKKKRRLRVWEVASSHRIKENKKEISKHNTTHEMERKQEK
jgi:hypothetical protein